MDMAVIQQNFTHRNRQKAGFGIGLALDLWASRGFEVTNTVFKDNCCPVKHLSYQDIQEGSFSFPILQNS